MILEARQLWCKFGGVAAVAGVDFRLEEGEVRCLIGANGAGKSTFFKMLTGQLRPTSGTITVMGRDATRLASFELARLGVGIKMQLPTLFNGLSVRESLMLAAHRSLRWRQAGAVAEAMLAEIELEAQADTHVGLLSHGQRQWVELGMVLASDPKLVLLDEPAAGMTQGEVEKTIALIGRLRGRRTVVVVEHDMHFVGRIAEKVTVFHRGQVLAEGTMDMMVRDPKVREVYLGRKAGGQHG
jgi:ABC-type uncharacterized transport system ATPase subunit